MYLPLHFREDRLDVLLDLIRKYPLATLVTFGGDGIVASHIPLVHDPEPSPWGTLHGHVARANSQWHTSRLDVEALAIFHGPQAYVSPSWYVTKGQTGRVVPTWNYVVVHVYGPLEAYADAARLREHLDRLTAAQEAAFAPPWTPADAPAEFIDSLQRAIVGIDLRITRMEGKWKASQNRPAEDRLGVIRGLEQRAEVEDAAMARVVRERSGTSPGG